MNDEFGVPIEMSVEEAQAILEEDLKHRKVVDDVYPWWTTLKWPLLLFSLVFGLLCIAVIFLAITLQVSVDDREFEYNQDACYDAFTSDSSNATARVRAAATQLDAAGWSALVGSVNGVEVTPEVVANVEELINATEEALKVDEAAIAARDTWVAEGRPLPCPIG